MQLREHAVSSAESAKAFFHIPDDVTYLNCANMAPQLRSVTEAGMEAMHAQQAPWALAPAQWFSGAERLRTLAARVLGTEADGVALVPAVSYGIAIAAANLPVSSGQKIILLDQEFPSNVYAWRELASRKRARVIHVRRHSGTSWTDALEEAIDRKTAIVAIPQCHWMDGSKIDLERVGKRVRTVGAGLVIDASQSLGAQRLDLNRVQPDFLVAVGYKWLLGPYGLGYLYAAPQWRESGTPLEQSWLARSGSEDFSALATYTDEYRPGARRFDMGEFPQFLLIPMAVAALQQILNWGVARVADSLAPLTNWLAGSASEDGLSVLPPDQRSTHMIGMRYPNQMPSGLIDQLKEQKIFVSIRGDSIRVAPHLYNDIPDLEKLFAILQRLHSGRRENK
ncbi:MAG TPA: aminotransferase class V-fold PLP-dependent enzyme [Terriglobales bacterium]|nr:aminotransferase class V-fold PLP-dependent enzyme [Terriglobales bacterium]